MNDPVNDPLPGAFEGALDAALRRELQPPALPAGFREQLRAAVARAPALDHERLRRQLENEQRAALESLRAGTVRMSREVFAMLIAIAFVVGIGAAWLAPGLAQRLDLDTGQLVALACAAGAAGFAAWVARRPLTSRLMRWLG
ncbi:MAG: hypothetical protein RL684_1115 [Pseudomonadota bacterium]|jgi:hypothetical protein